MYAVTHAGILSGGYALFWRPALPYVVLFSLQFSDYHVSPNVLQEAVAPMQKAELFCVSGR